MSERDTKRICLNKSSFFVGIERGGQAAEILAMIARTCRPYGVDPQHYLTQLATTLPTTPIYQIAQWLPDN